VVTARGADDYCAFTKAVEHLADRWTLLIIADLIRSGPRGFNALAAGVPGRISRSVLAERLRRLERLGIVSRGGQEGADGAYRLTAVGDGLTPTVLSLRDWAGVWLPDDPAAAEHDPDLVLAWLTRRIDDAQLPARRTVIEMKAQYAREHRCWLVLERGRETYGCFEDPMLDESRYVYLDATITVLLALAHGTRNWAQALADGSVVACGDPDLIRQLPTWFR
jgi:DNA-binding HxlR family transcriptional regulator